MSSTISAAGLISLMAPGDQTQAFQLPSPSKPRQKSDDCASGSTRLARRRKTLRKRWLTDVLPGGRVVEVWVPLVHAPLVHPKAFRRRARVLRVPPILLRFFAHHHKQNELGCKFLGSGAPGFEAPGSAGAAGGGGARGGGKGDRGRVPKAPLEISCCAGMIPWSSSSRISPSRLAQSSL